MAGQLPPGFVLDAPIAGPKKAAGGLPPGFVLDGAPAKTAAPRPSQGPQTVNSEGKGDMGLAPGEVARSTYAADIGRSAMSGVRSGLEMLAGTAGDLRDMSGNVAAWVAKKAGASPESAEALRKVAGAVSMGPLGITASQGPTTEQIQGMTTQIVGPAYQPQTTAGKYARTIGEFAPNVVVGPGGLGRKAAMTIIPAVASEALGQAAEGSDYEALARAGGALGGALLTGGRGNATKQLAKKAPLPEAVKAKTDALYQQLRDAGVQYDTAAFSRTATLLADKLQKSGFRKAQAPLTADIVEMVGERAATGKLDFDDLDEIRQATGAIMGEGPAVSNKDKAAASLVMDALDGFASAARLTTNGSIPPNEVNRMAKQARELAQRTIIARDIDLMISRSENFQSGQQSGIRNKFSSYLNSTKGQNLKKFDPVMYAAMQRASKGTVVTNLASHLGRYGIDPTKGGNIAALLSLGGSGYMAYNGNPEAAAALLAAGTAAKFGSRKAALRFAEDAKKVALAGRNARKSVGTAVKARNTATAATAGLSANQSRGGGDRSAAWPENAFLQDAKGRFFDRNGRLIPAAQ